MNLINFLILVVNLFGFKVYREPVRLNKKLTFREKINMWCNVHQPELLLVIIFWMMVTFVLAVLIFVPPMDMWNNHFQEVI